MKRRTITGILLIALIAVSVGVSAEDISEPTTMMIHIDVAPNTLNLESNGNGATVHTNIAYADVNCSTVTLKVEGADIPIRSCYSDLCGDLVVKVDREDVVYAIEDRDASPTKAIFTSNSNYAPTHSNCRDHSLKF